MSSLNTFDKVIIRLLKVIIVVSSFLILVNGMSKRQGLDKHGFHGQLG
uniref:Hypotheticial protein n=1 Tax=Schistosoma japonicum TaxID=6182 RepID=C1LNW9_SCHJA|nr:hypotheticial protein [Schistosoma japonicum]CAX76398.1 hypotheticial protein [Schistosoma japonicum]